MIETDLFLLKPARVCQELLAQLPEWLSTDEQHIWQAMTHPERRQEYLVSRSLLRQLVLALCPQGPLGVDIELGKRRHHPLPLARRFYAQSEYEWLCALPPQEQEGAFYRLWSRKEAVLKAHGGGIAAGLEKVRFLPEEGWRLDNRLDDTPYQVQDWPFASGWLSLAAAAAPVTFYRLDERLNCHSLNPMLLNTLSEESNS